MFARKPVWAWALLILVVATAAGLGYRQHKRYKHWATHDEGMVYRCAWLDSDVFAEQIEKYQIRTVLNVCNPGELGEERCRTQRAAVEGAGAKLIELPMPTTIDAGDPAIREFVAVLGNPNNYPLVVHCQHGVTRTAKVLVMYDILYKGETAEQSIRAMPLFGHRDYSVAVRAFAKDFENRHDTLYPQAQAGLDSLKR